jgi:hypothetical protein
MSIGEQFRKDDDATKLERDKLQLCPQISTNTVSFSPVQISSASTEFKGCYGEGLSRRYLAGIVMGDVVGGRR